MIEKAIFYILTFVLLVSALGVVTVRNVFHSALWLGLTLLAVAGMYLLLGAELLAAVQVLVYIGGILTLIIFSIMLTKNLFEKSIPQTNEQKASAIFISGLVLAVMVWAIEKTPWPDRPGMSGAIDTASIGRVLFMDYVLAFEVLSLILLLALAGAIVLARKEPHDIG